MTSRSLQARTLGCVAILSIALAACSTGAAATTTPTAGAPPASAAPSPSAAALIADGTYVAATMQVADIIALINADTKLSAAQKRDLIENAFVIKGHKTFAVSIELHGGKWTERQFVDGVGVVGSRATYAFPDEHTVVLEDELGISTFQVTLGDHSFSLKRAPTQGQSDNVEDALAGQILFESSPFTLAP